MFYAETAAPSFYVNDVPAPFVIELGSDDSELSSFSDVAVTMSDPSGETVAGVTASLTASGTEISFPAESVFDSRGIYNLRAVLTGDDAQIAVAPVAIVVEDGRWHTLTSARAEWVSAPDEDDILFRLLDTAHTQVIEYAPSIDQDVPVPSHLLMAQLEQAKALWARHDSNSTGTLGPDGWEITVTAFTMDKNIRQLIRPKVGVPSLW